MLSKILKFFFQLIFQISVLLLVFLMVYLFFAEYVFASVTYGYENTNSPTGEVEDLYVIQSYQPWSSYISGYDIYVSSSGWPNVRELYLCEGLYNNTVELIEECVASSTASSRLCAVTEAGDWNRCYFDVNTEVTPTTWYTIIFKQIESNFNKVAYTNHIYTGVYSYSDGVSVTFPGAGEDLKLREFYDDQYTGNPDYSDFEGELYFLWPVNQAQVDVSEGFEWSIYYDMPQYVYDNYEQWLLRITYVDLNSNWYLDVDEIATTTSPSSWQLWATHNEFGSEIGDTVFSFAEIWGTNDCFDFSSPNCEWTVLAESDYIGWVASSSGYDLFDNPYLTQPGFVPATSTLYDIFGASSTEDMGILREVLLSPLNALKIVFPLNVAYNIYDQWLISENLSLPTEITFLTDEIDNNSLNWNINLPGFSTSVPVLGDDLYGEFPVTTQGFFNDLRVLSSLALWLMFIGGMGWRAVALYGEFSA